MKLLGLMGSPRIGGNTDLLLDACIKGAESFGVETEKIIVDRIKITQCREFYDCLKDGNCVIQDDMLAEFWEFDRKLIHEKYEQIVQNLETRLKT
jgi:multimeric flavodoxin WrbA